jgi:outer membrane lipoprotein-sorting protein
LEKELQPLSFAPDIEPLEPGDVVLRGVPRALANRVAQIVLEITPEHWIRRILIEEMDASTTEYRFTDQEENLAVTDQKFQFQLPAGAEVIDGQIGP